MKSFAIFAVLFSSVSFANSYQTTGTTIKYDRQSHALIVGESQRVTDNKGNTFNRGIGTYIPLEQRHHNQAPRVRYIK